MKQCFGKFHTNTLLDLRSFQKFPQFKKCFTNFKNFLDFSIALESFRTLTRFKCLMNISKAVTAFRKLKTLKKLLQIPEGFMNPEVSEISKNESLRKLYELLKRPQKSSFIENFFNLSNAVHSFNRYIESIIVMDDSNEENEVYDDLQISIPSTLKEFVEMNLEIWIKNAYYAKSLQVDNNYIIGDTESQKQNEIIIMDKDTGIEQFSTKWSNGLHQFIQLKHNAKISDESLKAVYLSNAGFFQNYRKLYGMTGTIGGTEERKLLNKVYEIDFFDMPRFKEYRFEYDFESESISGTVNEWLEKIIDNIEDNMDQELVFTDKDIELFKIKYKEELQSLTKQKELYRNLINKKKQIEEKLQVSQTKVTTFETLHDACKSELSKDEIRQLVKSYDEEILHELRNIMNSKESAELQNETKKLLIKMYKEKENVVNFNNSLSKLEEEIEHLIATIERSDEDVQFYKKLSATSKDQERDSRRAILLICDNIADLNLIENNIRKYFHDSNSYRIFKYDRAYRKFDASRLEAGDIVIATNIAGRGTDIDVSKQVEENGGLHVILTYMPKNLRIEKQAFGRTARSGNQGKFTVTSF